LVGVGSFSRGYGYRFDLSGYFPRAIKTICLACVGVFLLQTFSGLFFHQEGYLFWLHYFGLSPLGVLSGFVWQPFTYLFLHSGILHILFNLLYLAMFGADLEHMWGPKRFTIYFFLCGVGAGLIDVIVRLMLDPHLRGLATIPTIGASGAIYGVLLGGGGDSSPASVDFPAACDDFDAVVCDRDGRDRILYDDWRDGRRRQPRLPSRRHVSRIYLFAARNAPLQFPQLLLRLEAAQAPQEIRCVRPRAPREAAFGS
jgi:hypothetical protein